jgi:drug/metabolite transporter (DMT)-like permease
MLVVVTVFWGLSFSLMKNCQDAAKGCPGGEALASATLIMVRMVLALAILAVVRPRLLLAPSRREYTAGAAIGIPFFLGFILQVLGLAWTTPAMSAFFTSLASAWVPLLVWVLWRTRVPRLTVVGLGLGLAGVAVMVEGWTVQGGDTLTLLASAIFAVEILLLDRLGKSCEPMHLTAGFLAITALAATVLCVALAQLGPGIGAWLAWMGRMAGDYDVVRDVGLLTVFCTVLAFHWMNVYQPQVAASRAALIYLLEPVFAALFSLAWGHDQLTWRLAAGGGIIVCGNLLVELPRIIADWQKARRSPVKTSAETVVS